MQTSFDHKIATHEDLPILTGIMDRAMGALLSPFLSPVQVEASYAVMGLDTQLVTDGTYFLVTRDGAPAGCGGWSRRATLYGGDHTHGRDAALLDPLVDAARVRAMYTDPAFVRQGVGRLILDLCERAARAEGFASVALVATMPGLPLYEACGYSVIEQFDDPSGGIAVPLARMTKAL
jgi:GNAT superfamily N-acetyltransferase